MSAPDLFWGLRGGKGSLGIVTKMEFSLLRLRHIYTGALFFGSADVETALQTWTQWCPTLPLAAITSIALMQLPPMPGVPEPLAGKFSIAAADTLLEAAGPDSASPQLMVEIRQLGGTLARDGQVPNALCHRSASFGLHTVGVAPPPELPAIRAHSAGLLGTKSP
ncbi:hypothetical protein [Arthrobacter sp. N199823]|uniref:hypothetical protein n=1 Tax=Arthrobacter sp. N199823 TaxID=2058895 RepID=UPI000CE573BA|nr:hypothetical protein [Arthrobacter sp. N199823]